MNDPQFVEAARHFAARILSENKADLTQRMAWAFEEAIARPPAPLELQELLSVYEDFSATYRADAAKALISIGEMPPDPSQEPDALATWTMVANVIFNLDQFISKE